MDVWIVAAAAGAGYVAKRLKNIRSKHNWSDLSYENHNNVRPESSNNRLKVQDKSCPFRRVLFGKSFEGEMSREGEKSCEDAFTSDIASTSGYKDENLVMMDNFAAYGTHSDSNYLAGFGNGEDIRGDLEGRVPSGVGEVITNDSLPEPSSSEMGFSYGFRKHRSSFRSRRINSQFIQPRTSLESCLMAQLYKEYAEIEEYIYSPSPLQKPTLRPFLVTDGSRIISKTPQDYISEPSGAGKCKLLKDTYAQEKSTVLGVPKLPNVASVKLRKNAKARKGKEPILRRTDSRKVANGNHNNAPGSSDGALLFYFGLTMGIMSSFLANKREMEQLNKLLKQSENLVQDLQDELEMKDSLTVKELAVEDYESQDVRNDRCSNDAVHALSLVQKLDDASRYSNEQHCDRKADEESLSKIEAELEAELERLASNMNSSRLEKKISNTAELDPNFVSDVVEGELRADLFGAKSGDQPYADRDGSGNSTPHSAHYSISPRELSLRLHEVIQSRLEQRVKELETALENSQRKVKYMESEHVRPSREISDNKTGTSSTRDSPVAKNGHQPVDQPVVINLSGDALAAYNEAYEEFTKISDSDEEDLQFGFENGVRVQDRDMKQHSFSNGSREMAFDRRTEEELHTIVCSSQDESEDDEMERLLIQQIIEKARKGSPAVLKAQRALLSTDEH
ncbi:hypothetical protein Salat_1539000 [Sesamum alatum]|uniref:Uncharacterized protein n=1 Tax=Sesamum alatum TaxID=300844 RepID=A0AAE2CML2_9LAMI|nr:hypothetical protein Salat_1539000 [Sesamum alatum]